MKKSHLPKINPAIHVIKIYTNMRNTFRKFSADIQHFLIIIRFYKYSFMPFRKLNQQIQKIPFRIINIPFMIGIAIKIYLYQTRYSIKTKELVIF